MISHLLVVRTVVFKGNVMWHFDFSAVKESIHTCDLLGMNYCVNFPVDAIANKNAFQWVYIQCRGVCIWGVGEGVGQTPSQILRDTVNERAVRILRYDMSAQYFGQMANRRPSKHKPFNVTYAKPYNNWQAWSCTHACKSQHKI